MYMYVCMYVGMYVCMYILYIYIYTYLFIHIFFYVSALLAPSIHHTGTRTHKWDARLSAPSRRPKMPEGAKAFADLGCLKPFRFLGLGYT